MGRTALLAATVLAVAGGWSAAGHAQNLVQNPGFELGLNPPSVTTISPPPDWTVGGQGDAGADTSFANSGIGDGWIGDGTLSQTLSTVAGTSYVVTFNVAVNDSDLLNDPDASFDATFDGSVEDTDLIGGPLTAAGLGLGLSAFQQFSYIATTDSASTVLTFSGVTTGDDGPWYIDDVSVSAVPEPSEALLLVSMLGTFALVRRRRT